VSYAFAGKLFYAAGAAVLALLATFLRWRVIPQMDALRAQIQLSAADAIRHFRRTHMSAIAINLAQLVLIVWSLLAVSVI
jgi:hypothetical protein